MKILLYSHYFYPSVGGVETVSLTLARGLQDRGAECKVVTATTETGNETFPFEVVRNPKRKRQIELVKWSDVILFNGASLALQPWILLERKPFVWIHIGYQVSCIDGLGWVDGKKAPLTPLSSIKFHAVNKGIAWAAKEGLKLYLRRFVAKNLATGNVAITEWMNGMQPLPRQTQIYNPFPIDKFRPTDAESFEYEFVYLGRIVSEKGVATLLRAFSRVLRQQPAKLLLIGDGSWRGEMEALAGQLQIANSIRFAGSKSGDDLLKYVAKGKIAVVPSEWYEPMGGVAVEMMAAGKNIIVSEYGGLKECVGDAGLTFKNGDDADLAECMMRLLNDSDLQNEQLLKAKDRVRFFSPDLLIEKYVTLLERLARKIIDG